MRNQSGVWNCHEFSSNIEFNQKNKLKKMDDCVQLSESSISISKLNTKKTLINNNIIIITSEGTNTDVKAYRSVSIVRSFGQRYIQTGKAAHPKD